MKTERRNYIKQRAEALIKEVSIKAYVDTEYIREKIRYIKEMCDIEDKEAQERQIIRDNKTKELNKIILKHVPKKVIEWQN